MFYKNWPYWLKGGIIMDLIIVILALFFYWFRFISIDISFLVAFLLSMPGTFLISGGTGCFDAPCSVIISDNGIRMALTITSNVMVYFIIGSIIGLIYGKIKKRN
jgi:hypothetical protein